MPKTKMQEIRENAKRADDMAKQLAAEGNLFPAEGVKSQFFTNNLPDLSQAPTTESDVNEAVQTEPSQPVTETVSSTDNNLSANENPSVEEVKDNLVSERQYKAAVKAMNDAQRQKAESDRMLKQQAEEHERFKAELMAIKQQVQQGSKPNNVSLVDQALSPYAEEYPDTFKMDILAANAVKEEVRNLIDSRFQNVEDQLRQSREEQDRFKVLEQIRLRDDKVKKVHPDYDDVRLSDDFKTWIYGEAPSLYKAVYEGAIPFDERDAVKIVSDFKSYATPPVENKTVTSRPKPGAAEASVRTASAVVADMGINNEPEFTAEDMQRLPYMINRVKDPVQRKALMDRAQNFMTKQISKTK